MPSQHAIEFQEVVQALLNEDQLFCLRERRDNRRKSFVRPVAVLLGDKLYNGFTRDLSDGGLGLIHKFTVTEGDQGIVTIKRLWDEPVVLKCQVRWVRATEHGWYQTGWSIVSIERMSKTRV